eukprot:TRINITY_DN1945_c0_g1_i1.p1 TRINITY_DN1945_c0_g1~~TRINITY_DN1945_c0_g1_i1.p1  ORF type:complete len:407 (+),score=93.65 TRINITY_DN1945_c0_g1_i1:47-1267(+)
MSRVAAFAFVAALLVAQLAVANQVPLNPNVQGEQTTDNGYKFIGYYTNWAQYRPDPYKFFPENIDANLFTHINYAFAKVEDRTWQILPYEWNDVPTMYNRMLSLKNVNPNLKVLISLGGWNFNSFPETKYIFSNMASSPSSRATFIQNCINYARTHGFDGVDIDWEYPANPSQGGSPQDKQNFVYLLREFRTAINNEYVPPGKQRLLLTIAAPAGESNIYPGYDIANIHGSLDWINLMTYDMHGAWESVTGANTPLYDPTSSLNIDNAVNIWLAGGAPANKLILGLGTYGRSWTLANPSNNGMNAPAVGAGNAGTYTREGGFLSYYEIVTMLGNGATRAYDNTRKVPYAYLGNQWVCYDDTGSIETKVDYLRSRGLGGGMVWALDLDEFRNAAYPLCRAAANRLRA